ncbi:MAG: ABC transporter ATP-binding protein [Bacteroidetes bacterium]|nr:MAG: ABC transporter ATP-binding protein [Bacteroidota bacterium]
MIELKNVTKVYNAGKENEVLGLNDASLVIEPGEFVSIIGASGSGKSTMMNILGLLDQPTSGAYLLDGKPVNDLTIDELAEARNRKFGFVFQQFHLLDKTTAAENVELPLIYSDKTDIRKKALASLESVGLKDRANHYPNELSGGQQQRVAIARALVNDPEVIFADEPTGNLDSESTKDILNILKRLNEQGRTIVIITHEKEIAAQTKRTIQITDGVISDDIQN